MVEDGVYNLPIMNGGVVAISGFLYQLLGSAAVLARASASDTAQILQEFSEEDALLRTESGDELIQYKYSSVALELGPKELAEILEKLEHHSVGRQDLKWRLVTNRSLSAGVHAVLEGEPDNHHLIQKAKPEYVAVIRRLGPKLTRETASIGAIQQLLQSRGQLFGLSDQEIENGALRIVGKMMQLLQNLGAGVAVNVQTLDEALVGFDWPGKLTAADICRHVGDWLETCSGKHGPPLKAAIARKDLQEIFTSAAPVVLVTGPGGAGKTLSVLKELHQYVLSRQRLGIHLHSDSNQTLSSIIAQWRQPKSGIRFEETLERCLERLKTANAGITDAILCVSLDGLDEAGWRPARIEHLRHILRLAMSQSATDSESPIQFKVIVTCRHQSDLEEILVEDGAGNSSPCNTFGVVALNEFDRVEFTQVWNQWFATLPVPAWSLPYDRRPSSADTEVLGQEHRLPSAVNERIIEALRNPSLMGCFAELTDSERVALLAGEISPWHSLMRRYLDWFARRVMRRHSIRTSVTSNLLKAAAAASSGSLMELHDYCDAWLVAGMNATGECKATVQEVFLDAVTSGLIVTDAGLYKIKRTLPIQWRWRHMFLADFLNTSF